MSWIVVTGIAPRAAPCLGSFFQRHHSSALLNRDTELMPLRVAPLPVFLTGFPCLRLCSSLDPITSLLDYYGPELGFTAPNHSSTAEHGFFLLRKLQICPLHYTQSSVTSSRYYLVITFLGSVVTAIGSLHQDAVSNENQSARYSPRQEVWDSAFPPLTLFTNGYATALIAARIWYFRRRERAPLNYTVSLSLGRTAAIVIESGAIYSATLIPFIALYQVKNNGGDILFNCIPQVIGIVFSLIVVRVAAGVSHGGLLRKQNGAGNTSVSAIAFRHSLAQKNAEFN
ncbi:hypothetical protein D9619_003864 [Psilocybe cf. subviscida]|uniref:Uncharacterized protein n=1 Tax=Psilocybe cf. subviscida TaxID=2480587 RepID=A0A8H5ETT3_9AGAR|nr:hypothetical protein D9619_003864 [Psilocybe cf. subviscida]